MSGEISNDQRHPENSSTESSTATTTTEPDTDFEFAYVLSDGKNEHTLESVVMQSIGAASVCWESMEGTGVFNSNRARQIGQKLLEWIRQNEKPLLGLATTGELIGELKARMEVTQDTKRGREFGEICGHAMVTLDPQVLAYRVVDS